MIAVAKYEDIVQLSIPESSSRGRKWSKRLGMPDFLYSTHELPACFPATYLRLKRKSEFASILARVHHCASWNVLTFPGPYRRSEQSGLYIRKAYIVAGRQTKWLRSSWSDLDPASRPDISQHPNESVFPVSEFLQDSPSAMSF